MKKSLLTSTLILLSSVSAFDASAKSDWSVGVFHTDQDFSLNGRDFNSLGLSLNYKINDYFSVEGRLEKGTSGYRSDIPDLPFDYKEDINIQHSLFVKGSYPIFREFSLYALAGYTNTELEFNTVQTTRDANENVISRGPTTFKEKYDGFSYGVGLSYQINDSFDVFIEHKKLPDLDTSSIGSYSWKSTSVGVNYRF